MRGTDEFLLLLHDISAAVDDDSLTAQERAAILAEYFHNYPPIAKQQLRAELRLLSDVCLGLDTLLDGDGQPK